MNLVLLYLVSSNMKLYFIIFYLYCFEKKWIIWKSHTMFAKEIIWFGLVSKVNKSSAAK